MTQHHDTSDCNRCSMRIGLTREECLQLLGIDEYLTDVQTPEADFDSLSLKFSRVDTRTSKDGITP